MVGSGRSCSPHRRLMTLLSLTIRRKWRSYKESEEKRWRTHPELKNAITDRGARRRLTLGKKGESCGIFRKTLELEIEKWIIGTSTGLPEVNDWTLWKVRPSPRRQGHRPRERKSCDILSRTKSLGKGTMWNTYIFYIWPASKLYKRALLEELPFSLWWLWSCWIVGDLEMSSS
jgi:hypothetical protein